MKHTHHKTLIPATTNYGYTNKAAGGHSFIGTSLVEYLQKAYEGTTTTKGKVIAKDSEVKINWPGRKANGWKETLALLNQPWPEAVAVIDSVIEAVSRHQLPEPHDVHRKMKWNDDEGEIDVPKAMQGESEIYRKGFRRKVKAPTQIVLLANLDCPYMCNKLGLFFRSIVTIVLADVLESKGYGVEVWAWCAGSRVFKEPDHYQFNALQCKRSDQPVDKDTLANVLSSWFTMYAIWASWNYDNDACVSYGSMIAGLDHQEEGYHLPEKQPAELKEMLKLIEPEEMRSQVYMIPQIWGADIQYKQVPHTEKKKRWVKDENGGYVRDKRGRRKSETYDVTTMRTVQVGAEVDSKAVAMVVKICSDVLNEIIKRESEGV